MVSEVTRNPHIPVALALRHYLRFYCSLARHRDRYVLGRFEEIVSDYGRVIERINRRFGTSFTLFEHTPENVERCFRLVEQMDRADTGRSRTTEATVARPSAERKPLAARLREEVEGHAELLAAAERIRETLALTDP